MANVTDSASVLVVPSGWSDGVLGSLQPDDGTGDFTFSRGSDLSATRVNEQGLIERGYENLLLQSNNFDTSPWTKVGLFNVLGNQQGYDSSNDAWSIESNSTAFDRRIQQSVSVSGVHTFAIYAKSNSTDWLLLYNGTDRVYFDLANGVVGSSKSGLIIDSKIESTPVTGWYRCTATFNRAISFISVVPASGDGNSMVFTGNSIYIQDAMLNQGLVAYPYIETTTTTAKNAVILEDQPRIDYTSGNGAVLLEPQRTNLLTYSEAIEFGISSNGCTQTITNETNPSGNDVSYLASAISSVNDQFRYDRNGLSSGSYFLSAFVKGDGNANTMRLRGTGGGVSVGNVYWNVAADGTITFDSPSGINAITESYGNGWYRIGYEETYDGTSTSRFLLYPSNGDVNASTYIWGIQWEEGSAPSAYIPTYGTSQTRLKDTATLTKNVTSTGTIYININAQTSRTLTFLGADISVTKGVNKIAMAYSPTALKVSKNGTIVANITRAFDTTALTQIQLGHRNNFEQTTDSINQFLTLDSFLNDTKLNELTA